MDLAAAEVIPDESERVAALIAVAQEQWQTDQTGASKAFRLALRGAHSIGRPLVFKALEAQARHIVRLDKGNTLWQIYQAVQEVDGWFGSNKGVYYEGGNR